MTQKNQIIAHLEKKSLKKVLSVFDVFAIGYSDLGSSIYYALGATAIFSLGATPISLMLAGLVFVCTALSYAELTSTIQESGGSASFARHAFNDLISFIAGWGLLLDYIVTIAISAFAIPAYIAAVFTPNEIDNSLQIQITVVIIFLLLLLNIKGVKHSGKFSTILAFITIVSQLFLIVFASFVVLNIGYVWQHLKIGVVGASWSPTWTEFLKGTAMAMVAYTGIESMAQLSSETKNAQATVPKAIKWTIFILLFLYLGISTVGLSVVSANDLGTKYIDNPMIGIVLALPFGGTWLVPWFSVIAAIVLLVASNAGLLGCSRLIFSMSKYYQVPRAFYKIHPKFQTPYISLIVFALLACLVVIWSRGKMLFLADLYNFGAQIAFFFSHVSLIALRIKRPFLERPYKAPLNINIGKNRSVPTTAIFGALASFGVWLSVIITKPEGRELGILWMVLGGIIYLLYRRKKDLPLTGTIQLESVKIAKYKPINCKSILAVLNNHQNFDSLDIALNFSKLHHAKLKAVFFIQLPESIPLDLDLKEIEVNAFDILKKADAISRDHDVIMDLKIIKVRSFDIALKEYIEKHEIDLVCMSANFTFFKQNSEVITMKKCNFLFAKTS